MLTLQTLVPFFSYLPVKIVNPAKYRLVKIAKLCTSEINYQQGGY